MEVTPVQPHVAEWPDALDPQDVRENVYGTYGRWAYLTQELDTACAGCSELAHLPPQSDARAATAQTGLLTVRRGAQRAREFAVILEHVTAHDEMPIFEHPCVQLARAYGAAFQAVGVAVLLLGDRATGDLPAGSSALLELARRTVHALHEMLDLVFGRRHLGSLTNTYGHLASLENRADDVFRAQVAQLLRQTPSRENTFAREAHRWQGQSLHLLMALEALTDRCEDIADALLLVAHIL